VPAPPPPPGPEATQKQRSVKMTTLNWEKLPRGRLTHTLWSVPQLEAMLPDGRSELHIDSKRLEALFCSKELPASRALSRKPSIGEGARRPAAGLPSASRVMLLDPKRTQNVDIMIRQLKRPTRHAAGQSAAPASSSLFGRYEEIPAEELRDAILEANTTTGPFAVELHLTQGGADVAEAHEAEKQRVFAVAKQVLEITPTPEESEKLLAFDGDEADLSKPDRYLRMLATIPRLEQRVRCVLFKLRFDDAIESAQDELAQLREATDAVASSARLAALMHAVLSVGNELNAGTMKGNAVGFRLSSLVRFCELRSNKDAKVTLLHYVVETLIENGAEVLLDVRAELGPVEAASRVSLSQLQALFKEWTDDLDKVDREIVTAEQNRTELADETRYAESLTFFYNQASELHEELKADLEQLERSAARLVRLFGEDPAETEPQSILGTLSVFLRKLEKAYDEVRRRREKEGHSGKTPSRRSVRGGSATPHHEALPSPTSPENGSASRRQAGGRSRESLSLVSAIDSIAYERPTTQRGVR